MQVHSSELHDFCEDNYTLIGLHTALEDYKLAYLLNKYLNKKFVREIFSLDFNNKDMVSSFSVYGFIEETSHLEWYLVSNTYVEEVTDTIGVLALTTQKKTYLIPEKKRVDYFIKILGDISTENLYKVIQDINQLEQIVTSYIIETDKLKSKDFLIF